MTDKKVHTKYGKILAFWYVTCNTECYQLNVTICTLQKDEAAYRTEGGNENYPLFFCPHFPEVFNLRLLLSISFWYDISNVLWEQGGYISSFFNYAGILQERRILKQWISFQMSSFDIRPSVPIGNRTKGTQQDAGYNKEQLQRLTWSDCR